MKNYIILCMMILVISSCTQKKNNTEKEDFRIENNIISIDKNSPIINKLESEVVKPSVFPFELTTAGIVEVIPNNFALIAAPFAGRITKSYIKLGQMVHIGSPIFEISSPDYFETTKAYFQSKEEMELAKKSLSRQRDLLQKGVGVQKDLEEAEVNYEIKKKDYENCLASLKVYQVDATDLILGQPLIVRSPINGKVVVNNIVIGQYIKEDSDPVATVAELSKVWVAGQVKEKDIRYIYDISDVNIELISFPEKNIKGKIYHVNSLIDEDTRSVEVLIECENQNEVMKPGMYVTAKMTHLIPDVFLIPSKAVFQDNGNSFVFVILDKNQFQKRQIEILTEVNNQICVQSGLKNGDHIVSSGGFYLLDIK